MTQGKITIISPPDRLFNETLSYLLVKPSMETKQQFYNLLSNCIDNLTIFVFDKDDTDVTWLLSVASQVDVTIIDIDNCDEITRQFVSLLLYKDNSYYITTDETTPYNLISKNRIYDLYQLIHALDSEVEDSEDDEDDF